MTVPTSWRARVKADRAKHDLRKRAANDYCFGAARAAQLQQNGETPAPVTTPLPSRRVGVSSCARRVALPRSYRRAHVFAWASKHVGDLAALGFLLIFFLVVAAILAAYSGDPR